MRILSTTDTIIIITVTEATARTKLSELSRKILSDARELYVDYENGTIFINNFALVFKSINSGKLGIGYGNAKYFVDLTGNTDVSWIQEKKKEIKTHFRENTKEIYFDDIVDIIKNLDE